MPDAPGSAPFDRAQFESRLRAYEVRTLFGYVQSETTWRDKVSLLALRHACLEAHGTFRYLEIGSHLGGSLQALIADPCCTAITSIDSRPQSQPDVRGVFDYPGNSTERMLEFLARVPGADLTKLCTIEASTESISPAGLEAELCFIDAEHTHEAALRDGRFCREVLGGRGAIAFHDYGLIQSAVEVFTSELEEGSFKTCEMTASLFVVELGPPRLLASETIRTLWSKDMEWVWRKP